MTDGNTKNAISVFRKLIKNNIEYWQLHEPVNKDQVNNFLKMLDYASIYIDDPNKILGLLLQKLFLFEKFNLISAFSKTICEIELHLDSKSQNYHPEHLVFLQAFEQFALGNFEISSKMLSKLLSKSSALPRPLLLEQLFYLGARNSMEMKNFAQAENFSNELLEIALKTNQALIQADAINLLAMVAAYQLETKDAYEGFMRARAIYKYQNELDQAMQVEHNLGVLELMNRDYSSALKRVNGVIHYFADRKIFGYYYHAQMTRVMIIATIGETDRASDVIKNIQPEIEGNKKIKEFHDQLNLIMKNRL